MTNTTAPRLFRGHALLSFTKRLLRKRLRLALRRPVEEGDKLINDGAPMERRRRQSGARPGRGARR
jgi:hypothetical protein